MDGGREGAGRVRTEGEEKEGNEGKGGEVCQERMKLRK